MDINIQLICIIFSFIYGAFIRVIIFLNKLLIKNNNIIVNIISNILLVYLIVLLYILIIYKINKGIFHIYFLLLILLGYLFMSKNVKYLHFIKNKIKNKIKK